jgi:hypothetical protein
MYGINESYPKVKVFLIFEKLYYVLMENMKMNTKRIIKIIGGIILGVILLIVILIAYFFLIERAYNIQQDKVEITVEYNLGKCTKEYPLYIENSDKTVDFVDFGLTIYRKGYSTNISDYVIEYESDKIIESNHSWGTCWHYKLKSKYKDYDSPDNLEFKISYKFARFQE